MYVNTVKSFVQHKLKHYEYSEGSAKQRPDILNKFKRWMDSNGLILQLVTSDDVLEYSKSPLREIRTAGSVGEVGL